MHLISEKEMNYELDDTEVVNFAAESTKHLKEGEHFKRILVKVEYIPYYCGDAKQSAGGDYTLLSVVVESDTFGGSYSTDPILVERSDGEEESKLQLIERGKAVVGKLMAAMPDTRIQTQFPKVELSSPQKPNLPGFPSGTIGAFYMYQNHKYDALFPSQDIFAACKEVLQEHGCEIVKTIEYT